MRKSIFKCFYVLIITSLFFNSASASKVLSYGLSNSSDLDARCTLTIRDKTGDSVLTDSFDVLKNGNASRHIFEKKIVENIVSKQYTVNYHCTNKPNPELMKDLNIFSYLQCAEINRCNVARFKFANIISTLNPMDVSYTDNNMRTIINNDDVLIMSLVELCKNGSDNKYSIAGLQNLASYLLELE